MQRRWLPLNVACLKPFYELTFVYLYMSLKKYILAFLFYSSTLATTQILCTRALFGHPTPLSYPCYFGQSQPPLETKNLATSLHPIQIIKAGIVSIF